MSTPAELLTGHVINGWLVQERTSIFPGQSGGTFSKGYFVTKDGKKAFLKAMDLHDALKKGLKAVEKTTRQYNFERELQCLCRDKRLSNIVKLLDDGEYLVGHAPPGVDEAFNKVYYMIFERAEGGDIRREISFDGHKTNSWKAFVLHQIAVALTQLHKNDIAHQDLKPSNVLSFKEEKKYKLTDLGRSFSKNHRAPTDSVSFPGDWNYAPPEYFYGYTPNNLHDQRYGSDAYLLGSMLSFLFSGYGALSLTICHLPQQYRHETWNGNFDDVLLFLIDAHTKAANTLRSYLPIKHREEMALNYFQLCHPDPQVRGHPATRLQAGKLLGLDRYVSRFNHIALELETAERIQRMRHVD